MIENCWQQNGVGELVINLDYINNTNDIILKRCPLLKPFNILTLKGFSNIEDIISYAETFTEKPELAFGLEDRCLDCKLPTKIKKVVVGLSRACNLNCYHCFVKGLHQDDDTIKNLYFNTLEKIKGHHLEAIKFTDIGEPFYYYFQIIDYLSSLKYEIDTKEVQFITNLNLLNEKRLNELKEISTKTGIRYFFDISFDGITKESYEKTRVNGSFEKVMNNLKLCVQLFGTENVLYQYVIKAPNFSDDHKSIESFFSNNFGIKGRVTYDTLDDDAREVFYEKFNNLKV